MSLFEATGHIGLPYLYLGCGFAKKALFFYFSSSLFCDAESTTTDNIVFRKPTRPSLALRKAFSNPSVSLSKGSSTSSPKPPPPQKEGDVTAPPRSSNRYAIRLADHQRSAPGFCAGWDRLADLDADSLFCTGCIRKCYLCCAFCLLLYIKEVYFCKSNKKKGKRV